MNGDTTKHMGTTTTTGRFGPHGLHAVVRTPGHTGAAPPARRTFVLAHALGCDHTMWNGLADALAEDAQVICCDQLGHGASLSPPGPYDMALLADAAAGLIDAIGRGPVTWIGLSMGGMVGQELALRHPSKVQALVLANTTSAYPAAARDTWAQRVALVRDRGMEAVVEGALQRWLHDGFRAAQPAVVAHWGRRLAACDPAGYIACCEAVAGIDTTSRLHRISVPTLVLAGELDQGTPPAMARTIAEAIPGARLVVLPDASHLSVLEQPVAFEAAVRAWRNDAA